MAADPINDHRAYDSSEPTPCKYLQPKWLNFCATYSYSLSSCLGCEYSWSK